LYSYCCLDKHPAIFSIVQYLFIFSKSE
jgi:hypothetical protein